MTWKCAKIGDLGTVTTGKTPPTKKVEYFDGEYPFVTPGDLGYDSYKVLRTDKTVTEAARDKFANQFVGAGSIFYTCIASVGKAGIAVRDCLTNQQINSITASEDHDSAFIYYLLRNETPRIKAQCGGVATPIINKTDFEKVEVQIPSEPHVEQTIASILSAYDDLIKNNQRRIALLEEAARLLYREWFVHFRFPGHEHVPIIDGLPEVWERRTFDEVCDSIGGGTPKTGKPEFWDDGDVPWYTPTDITQNSCLALLDSVKKITEAGLRGSSAKMLPAGTVLMTSRASVGFFGVIDTPSCTNQGFISIVPHDSRARMYLLYNLMHRVEEIRSHAGGATYKEISKGKFRALPVVIPHDSLLREFEEQASTFHSQVRTLHSQNQKLAEARDLLLPRLMNGEIAV